MFSHIFPKIRVDFIIEGWHNRCQHSWYFQESKTVNSFLLINWCEYWDFERRSFYKVIKATNWKMFLSCPLIIVTYFWYFVKLGTLIVFKCNFLRQTWRPVCFQMQLPSTNLTPCLFSNATSFDKLDTLIVFKCNFLRQT